MWERGTDWGLPAPVPWGPGLLPDWGDHGSGRLLSPAPWSQAPGGGRSPGIVTMMRGPGPVPPVRAAPIQLAPPARPGPGHPHSPTSTCPPRPPATPIHPPPPARPGPPRPGGVGALSACPLRSAVLVNTSPGVKPSSWLAEVGPVCLLPVPPSVTSGGVPEAHAAGGSSPGWSLAATMSFSVSMKLTTLSTS